LKHIDAAALYYKLIQASNEIKQQSEVKYCSYEEGVNQHGADLRSFRNDLQAVTEETEKSANRMSEVLTLRSEINLTVIKLTSIKHDLRQLIKIVKILEMICMARAGSGGSSANTQVFGFQDSHSEATVCGPTKTDI